MSKLIEGVCYTCKEPMFIPAETDALLRRNHQTFYCLWGHGQIYAEGPSEAELLRRERDKLKQEQARILDNLAAQKRATERERQEREHAERRVSAAKGRITRMKNRSAEGRCPCCNRVFVDLRSHMKSKHAEYEAEVIDLAQPEEQVA